MLLLSLLLPVCLVAVTLQEAEELALRNNQSLQISREQKMEALYLRRQAQGGWYPGATFAADGFRTAGSGNTGYSTSLSSRLRFSQTVFDPNVYYDVKLRTTELRERENDVLGFHNEVLFQLRTAYYVVVLSDQQVKVEAENIGLLMEAAEREEGRRETGEATAFDVNQSKVSTQNARREYYRVLRESKQARNDLMRIMGEDPIRSLEPDDKEISIENIPLLVEWLERYEKGNELYTDQEVWDWESVTLSNRPEIEQQRLALERARRESRKALAQYAPSVGASATFVNRNTGSSTVLVNNSFWEMSVGLDWVLFDGLKRENVIWQRNHGRNAAELRYEDAIHEAKAQVRNRFYEIEQALRTFVAARDSVKLAEESLGQAQDRRDVGEITPLEYRDATTSLTRARRDYYEASFGLLISYYSLRNTSGLDTGYWP